MVNSVPVIQSMAGTRHKATRVRQSSLHWVTKGSEPAPSDPSVLSADLGTVWWLCLQGGTRLVSVAPLAEEPVLSLALGMFFLNSEQSSFHFLKCSCVVFFFFTFSCNIYQDLFYNNSHSLRRLNIVIIMRGEFCKIQRKKRQQWEEWTKNMGTFQSDMIWQWNGKSALLWHAFNKNFKVLFFL